MGFLCTLFSMATNKWVETSSYIEQKDCGGDGHKIRIVSGELRIYPNAYLLNVLRKEQSRGIIMQFSANGSILGKGYEMAIKDDYVVEKYCQFIKIDFDSILHRYGAIQIGINGIMAGVYNSKGYNRGIL